jgi:hypothetical protein
MLNVSGLKSDLESLFGGLDTSSTAQQKGMMFADAVAKYVTTGMAMVQYQSGGGPVAAGAITVVAALGVGGIDKSSPGMTLAAAAQTILIPQLQAAYDAGANNPNVTASDMAGMVSQAIHLYYSEALVMTLDMGSGAATAPGPGGMASFTSTIMGGIGMTAPLGLGFDGFKSVLATQLGAAFDAGANNPQVTSAMQAMMIGMAIDLFCEQGKVVISSGMMMGNNAITPPPPPPPGLTGAFIVDSGMGMGMIS